MLRFVGPLIVCSLNARTHSGDCTGRRDAITFRKRGIANGLPLDFFVRHMARKPLQPDGVSSKGAQGIAQFTPRTADWRARQSHMHINFGLFADILRELGQRLAEFRRMTSCIAINSRMQSRSYTPR